ncbi:MAG: NAD(+)/NADH kinase [Bacteroidales bacterium]|nr:NAD(+)/NADH kinase [Bacteroidales bacterium]
MKIAIFGNEFQHEALAGVATLLAELQAAGVELWGEQNYVAFLERQLGNLPAMATFEHRKGVAADVALSIGGDGTFLRTAQAMALHGTPIMGINAGHLGYLTTVDISEAAKAVKCLMAGDYDVEERSMLQLLLPPGFEIAQPFALNEVAILRQDTSSSINVDASLDDVALTTFKGDGMLLCTPTGSTAYNLSVGGPILHPQSRCFALAPISPHSLTMRPVVFSDTSMLRITARSRASVFQVSVDGETIDLPSGTTLRIAKAPFPTRVIMLKGHRFARVLRSKLMWGRDNRGEE